MAEESNYWARRRISRRAALRGAGLGVAGLAGAALIGCGGDDDEEATATATATAAGTAGATAEATTAATEEPSGPTVGGTGRWSITGDPPTLDPYGNLSYLTKGWAANMYSRLYMYEAKPGIPGAATLPMGDLAESAEVSDDGKTWVIKLRPNAKYQNIQPVGNRRVTATDVKYSWDRLTAPESANAGQVSIVSSMDVVDDSTLRFNLSSVSAVFLDMLADANLLWVMPTESEFLFNPQTESIGSGPWIIKEYIPDVRQVFERNPEWHFSPRPYLQERWRIVIPEYANSLAQFQAGNLESVGLVTDDVIPLKENPKYSHWQWATGDPGSTLSFLYFNDIMTTDKPWGDERVRQAISRSFDRAAILDFAYNVDEFKKVGLNPSEAWHNLIPVGKSRWWLDPQSAAQGPSAEYFQYSVAESKKLLAATDWPDGFDVKFIYNTNRYGSRTGDVWSTKLAYFEEVGINAKVEVQDYSSIYITQTFAGDFEGMASGWETPFPEAGSYPMRMFSPTDSLNHSRAKDDKIWELTIAQNQEIDFEARREMLHEIQRINDTHMYYIPGVYGGGTGFSVGQPWLMNYGIYRSKGYGGPAETTPYTWIDQEIKAQYT